MKTDSQLFAEYVHQGSEAAFRELVERHIDLVHSAALRESRGDGSVAEDITQAVFTEMARCATKLVSHPAFSGWLYTCVRRMTANAMRAEQRRKDREQKAFAMNELLATEPGDQLWQQVRPVLDDAMHELDQEDRTAVVLRFFEERSLKEVGAALGLNENAARMRIERSLEKLHGLLSRKGINSSASTLATVLVAGAALKAPSALASSVATAAMTAVPAVANSSMLTAAKLLTVTRTKAVVVAASVVMVATFLLFNHLHSSLPVHPASGTLSTFANLMGQQTPSASTDSVVVAAKTVAASVTALQCLDAETGAPLPDTKLHLFYMFDDGRGKIVKSVTDSNGRLAVEKPQPPYRYLNMFVTAEGHVPKVTRWGLERQMPMEYTMKLERGVTISGVVVDQTEQPVPGAKIQLDTPDGNDPSLVENIEFGPDTTATTDKNGHWSCNMIPQRFNAVTLTVIHPEFAETNVTVQPNSADATNLLITLSSGFVVRGLVEDNNGNAVEGATVRQVLFNKENEHSKTTDASGVFEFKSISPGELMLAVQATGYAPAVQTLHVTDDIHELQFQLGPGQLLRGQITDEKGDPVANAFIETTRSAADRIRWSTNADANGRFEWDSAPKEPLLYSVLAEGFNRAYAQTLRADGSEQQIKLTRFQPVMDNIQVTGTAVDSDTSLPLESFKVFMSDLDADFAFPLQFCTEAVDGKFNVSFKAKSSHPGYRIQIEKEGYLPAASADLLKKAGNLTLEFQLRKGTGPSGVVLLPSGEPASDATVLLCTCLAGVTIDGPAQIHKGLNTTAYQTQTDAEGRFSLAPAVDPQGLIIIHEAGYAEISLPALAAGGSFTLQPWGRVTGKVVLDSRPAANQHVGAYNFVARYSDTGRRFGFLSFHLEATTDADGKFSFDKVPPGRCKIFRQEVRSLVGFESHETSVEVKSGTQCQVVLGGSGRTIIGKAVLPSSGAAIDWQTVPVRLRLKTVAEQGARPKRADFSSTEAFIKAQDHFFAAYDAQKRFGAFCDNDGSFRVPDVPAGTYELQIKVRDSKSNSVTPHNLSEPMTEIGSVGREVIVSETPEGQSAEPIDLGTVELVSQQESASTR